MYTIKTILLGDSSVGKSSIAIKTCHNKFTTDTETTIGVDYFHTNIYSSGDFENSLSSPSSPTKVTKGNFQVKMQIWDTAGNEQYASITKQYYRDVCGIVLIFDLTNRISFYNILSKWLPEIKKECPSTSCILLVGNKSDMNSRVIKYEEGIVCSHVISHEFPCEYVEVSAKKDDTINLFTQLSEIILRSLYMTHEDIINTNVRMLPKGLKVVTDSLISEEVKKPPLLRTMREPRSNEVSRVKKDVEMKVLTPLSSGDYIHPKDVSKSKMNCCSIL